MNTASITRTLRQTITEPLETLRSQVAKPIGEETIHQLKGFLGPQEIAKDALQRVRDQQNLEKQESQDHEESAAEAEKVSLMIKEEYRTQEVHTNQEQNALEKEYVELKEEIAKLAETSGIETKTHLETSPKKIGILDIKRLRTIIKQLTMKVEESKNAQELVAQRTNAKRTTGMLAWVSGKQMKVHEQGTLQLQG